ncbi:Pectinesterase inhibitor [Rhynchospora pubera]|uniref:Pectinesterase inhibitor n=1 Tax=Rhynchospora pubera TaxID=906938 RepID=A0AAV8DKP7_9POAL|nr:Pectinesterase inhibitor [Rhynchospora pubera]KAJ4808833.1 Pectinesterase inhibitor [Rhynchospora pubera]
MAEGRRSVLMLINHYCFVIITASICLLEFPVLTCANKNFVLKTCNSTDIPDLCAQILLSDPRSVNVTDVRGLTDIALDIAARSADSASSHASDLADKYAGLPEQEPLDSCTQGWSEAADDLRDAQEQVDEANYTAAARIINEAVDNGDDCEKAFADKGLKSVMADVDKTTSDQVGLAADLIDLLNVP